MSLLPDNDSKLQKGLVLLGGLSAVAALAVVAGFLMFGRSGEPLPRPVSKPTSTTVLATTREPLPVAIAPEPPKAKADPEETAKVARAMDQSNIRSLVRTLSGAAATDNEGLKQSMKKALRRYGAQARPLIETEYASATDPKVQAALKEAMSDAR